MIKIHLSRILGERRINRHQIAKETGIRDATLSMYYHEQVQRIDLGILDRLCAYLGCQVGELLEYIPDQGSEPAE